MCAMLLAEALAARKDCVTEIEALSARLKGAVVRYEDQTAAADDPASVLLDLETALDRLEDLTVRINRTNNATRVAFAGRDLSLMEAIAMRERLVLEAKARRGGVEAVELATGVGRSGRGWLGTKRAKDEVRELPTVDLQGERSTADKLSERVRLLDLAVQQRNWTTQLSE
jgi:hypothetical protein